VGLSAPRPVPPSSPATDPKTGAPEHRRTQTQRRGEVSSTKSQGQLLFYVSAEVSGKQAGTGKKAPPWNGAKATLERGAGFISLGAPCLCAEHPLLVLATHHPGAKGVRADLPRTSGRLSPQRPPCGGADARETLIRLLPLLIECEMRLERFFQAGCVLYREGDMHAAVAVWLVSAY